MKSVKYWKRAKKLRIKILWNWLENKYQFGWSAVYISTVPTASVPTKPYLCTKQPIFNMLDWIVKIPPHSSLQSSTLALTGALNWGTVWASTSTSTGIVKGQSLSNQIYFTKKKPRSTLTFHNSCASWSRSLYSTSS